MTVHDAIPERKRLNGQLQLLSKTPASNGGGFCFWLRVEAKADEWLSTTLYPKESGLTVSFLIQRKPSSAMAGVFASGFGFEQRKRAVCGKPGCHQPHHDSYGHAFSSPGFIYFK
ncbi:hypothetical protein [Klebsiella oxytoca]|uniref:hypothetical protein n=1 Tax=Klebsiella oxytoca TaxID=571 RepID=UPI00124805A4|nr:hypothetical protein [Klebsiella oxytoca]